MRSNNCNTGLLLFWFATSPSTPARSHQQQYCFHTERIVIQIAHVPVEKLIPLERVQQRAAEQVMYLPVLQVMKELSRLSKLSRWSVFLRGIVNMWWTSPFYKSSCSSLLCPRSQAKTESWSVPWNSFLAVPVTLIVEQFGGCADIVFQDRTQQRTLMPQVVEELLDSQDSDQQLFAEQSFENLAVTPTDG